MRRSQPWKARTRRAPQIALAAATALLVTACGSTAVTAGRSSAGTGDATLQGQAGASQQGATGLGSGSTSTGGTAAVGGTTGALTGSGTSGTAGSAGTGTPTSTGNTVPGGTQGSGSLSGALVPATFTIGLQYSGNANAAMAAVGGGAFKDDRRPENDAVIAWINKHGGIAGRPASPIYNNIDATANPQTESQSACAQWTQDNHVAIAFPRSAVADNDLLRACLKRAGVPAVVLQTSRTLGSSFASSPLWFEPTALSLGQYARTYVRGLAGTGFFKTGKVGVVYYDNASFPAALKSDLLPELKAAGVPSPELYGASIDSASTLGSGSQQMSSAVLAFRSKGVTKVLFFEPWVGYFEFLNNAKSQQYHPEYGLSSQEGPQLAMDLGLVPADQLAGARVVSWTPASDVRHFQPFLGPRIKLCTQIYRDAGIVIASDQTSYGFQMTDCEYLMLIQDAYRSAPHRLVAADFVHGAEALGDSQVLATRTRGGFGPTKHWGIDQYWTGHFDTAQSTFVIDSSAQQVR
ncbi:MAG: hypothetical protein M3N21_07145 [Actinomycetota bacterium]|nr:hypothetical protein [Actinomycetota bacterium]